MTAQTQTVNVKKGYVDGRFGQIHYRLARPNRDSGKTPLLCFHMSPYSSIIYERFLAEMGRDRLAVAMDTPGFGESDAPADRPSIADYAGTALDLIEGLGLTSANVMGYHTGAETAIETALQAPDTIRRVVMVSAPIWTPDELVEVKALYGPESLTRDGSHLQKWWQSAIHWSMDGRSLEDIGRVFWARVMNPEHSWWGHAAAFDYALLEALPKVAQPVLILNPEDDVYERTPRAQSALVHPESRIHDLPGWSHGFLDLKTVEAAQLVRGFLDQT